MKNLPWRKQLVLVAIVGGVAALTSFLLAFLAAAAAGRSNQPLPSPLIGLSFGVVAGAIYLALSGNRHVALADDATRRAALAPSGDGLARLIVFRRGFVGKLAGVDVLVDGTTRTQLKSPRFAVLTVEPGARIVETQMQNKRSAPLAVTLAVDGTAAVEIVVGLGKARPVARPDVATVRDELTGVPMVVA